MRLNHDCVRDVMLYLEENLTPNIAIDTSEIELPEYDVDTLRYTCKKLSEAGYIKSSSNILGNYLIEDITYNGHLFLDNIRDSKIWSETKSKISKLASVSLPIIQQVASQIISSKLGI